MAWKDAAYYAKFVGAVIGTAAVTTVGILIGKGLHAGIFLIFAGSIGTLLGMRDTTTGGAIAIEGTTEEMDEQKRKKTIVVSCTFALIIHYDCG